MRTEEIELVFELAFPLLSLRKLFLKFAYLLLSLRELFFKFTFSLSDFCLRELFFKFTFSLSDFRLRELFFKFTFSLSNVRTLVFKGFYTILNILEFFLKIPHKIFILEEEPFICTF